MAFRLQENKKLKKKKKKKIEGHSGVGFVRASIGAENPPVWLMGRVQVIGGG